MLKINIESSKITTRVMIIACFSMLFLLYLLPTFVQVEFDKDLHIENFYLGLPGVISGDEPHYLVTTSSLINDHDYYIENNYDNAYFYGGCDVSFHYSNSTNPTIWRHIQIVAPEQRMAFPINVSENMTRSIPPISSSDLDEFYRERVQNLRKEYNLTVVHQVSNRPLGLPLFSTFFLWPLKNTCLIEHGAIYLTLAVSFIGLIYFFLISLFYLRKYKSSRGKDEDKKNVLVALFFTIILALCTQYWFYSKTYFTEPYLAAFLLVAYYFFFIKKQNVLPGLLLGIGFSMKYPFGMYLGIFGLLLLWKKEWKRMVYFVMGSSFPILITFYYNWLISGHILSSAQSGSLFFGNYLYGVFVWLLDPTFGLLPFAPFLMFSILGLLWLWKEDRETAIVLTALIVPYFLFWSSYTLTQIGAGGYSARYLIPFLSFFVLLCALWYQQNEHKILFWLFVALVAISFVINMQAAFLYPLFWNNPPWIVFDFLTNKGERILELWNKM